MSSSCADFPGLPKPASLLVVEDENRLRELLMDVATDMGFTAIGARSAEEGLRLLGSEQRDAIILDLNLPGMGGIEFLAGVRECWPNTQVIILTGFGSLESARAAIHFDVVEFLIKPCPLREVELALDRARRKIAAGTVESPRRAPRSVEPQTLHEHERNLILQALERNRGNRTAAAEELGISRRTLYYKLQEYGSDAL